MATKIDAINSATAYHIDDGATVFPYAVDAQSAVSRFPKEWSFTPWQANGEKGAPVIDIHDGWQDLRPIERINLAASLGEPRKGLTAAKADEAIQAEVDRRESEPADQPVPAAKLLAVKAADTAPKPAAPAAPAAAPSTAAPQA